VVVCAGLKQTRQARTNRAVVLSTYAFTLYFIAFCYYSETMTISLFILFGAELAAQMLLAFGK
jgi:hypothetical protein